MPASPNKVSRRQQILESLAHMLEASPGTRITTAKLAKEVGFSEAALYRHFPSKAKMFEGLIEFIEDTIFGRINIIASEEISSLDKCERIVTLMLSFAEKNPGITRIMTGEALSGETQRLHLRIIQFYDRVETHLKQIIREAQLRENCQSRISPAVAANLIMAATEGRISQFVRSGFKRPPTQDWKEQWAYLSNNLFVGLEELEPAL
ncbi:MAG: nucleoid occlusion factor SlmA [Gammaproteobacteria bacterium]|nr:MAG: nucleoid occlusion factor SlmA [Gammaproteobacteria bacterium]